MEHPGSIVLSLILVAAGITLFLRPSMLEALIEAIRNFRGGPPTPMHPSPSNDAALLRKRIRKVQN
jgi:hypothetical protein